MDSKTRDYLVVGPQLSSEPAVGAWLWALEDARRRTLRMLEGLNPTAFDWLPSFGGNSIGTVLYHMALIEADWLYTEVLQQPVPSEVEALFPFHARDEQGNLSQVEGLTRAQHLERLAAVRGLLLAAIQPLELAEFRRVRSLPDYDVTPEWVLHHLIQHEAEHRGEIGVIARAVESP